MIVKILDWIFKCNYMNILFAVYNINKRRKCCRFTTSGRSCHKHKPSLFLCKLYNMMWDSKTLGTWNRSVYKS